MSLSGIQHNLQQLYELDISHSINDYLISYPDLLNQFEDSCANNMTREKLLIHEQGEEVSLSLYLHQEIVRKFECRDITLTESNIEDFCLALEGISHFLYLVWNAGFDRSVTKLEMELQAEIDKFVMLMRYAKHQDIAISPASIRHRLFEAIRYHAHLDNEELRRYQDANKYAEKYCWQLELAKYLDRGAEQELLRELRRFYRLDLESKLRHINN
jgi:hypothetical protein